MKKTLSLILVLAMLMSLLAACGGTAASTAETASAPAASTEETAQEEPAAEEAPTEEEATPAEGSAAEEPVTEGEGCTNVVEYPIAEEGTTLSIFWMFHNFLSMFNITQDVINDIPTFAAAEEATGIKLDFRLSGEEIYSEQIKLLWASGDYCDLLVNGEQNYASGVDAAVEEEVLLDLVPYLEEHAPDYLRIMEKHPSFRTDLTSAEGYIVSFSEYCEYVDGGVAIRKDWLDQVGMEVPSTMDEVTEVARAFKEQLGIRNPIMWNSDLSSCCVWNGYGVTAPSSMGSDIGWQIDSDGLTVVPSIKLEGTKKALQWMHDAFAEGLCTDDFMNVMNIAFDEYVYANETGIVSTNANLLADGGAERSGQPDYDLRAIPDPVEEEGMDNPLGKTSGGIGASAIAVSALSEVPELAIEYMNWLYTEEGILVSNYGVEGEAFEYVDGKPAYTDLVLANPDGMPAFVATFRYTSLVGTPYYNTTERKIASFTSEAEKECFDIWITGHTGESIYQGKMTVDESEEYNSLATDIATAVAEQTLLFVTGERSLDEYDEFVADMEGMGLPRMIELKQAAYDRYLENQ